jgi:hypothetical protein
MKEIDKIAFIEIQQKLIRNLKGKPNIISLEENESGESDEQR